MRALLDVNVLVALFDEAHAFNERAHTWFESNDSGWASCPLTENGLIRILTNQNYSPKVQYAADWVLESLRGFCSGTNHVFWSDEITLRDTEIFVSDRIHGSRQITDIYLLGLATHLGGKLVTFDQTIPLSIVKSARRESIVVL